MSNKREFNESPLSQGRNEQIAYEWTTTPWGGSPSSPTVYLYELPDATDVSDANLSGDATVDDDVVTTPTVTSLELGKQYLLEILVTIDGNLMSAVGVIEVNY